MTVTGKFAATFLELALATEGEAGIEPQASELHFLQPTASQAWNRTQVIQVFEGTGNH